MTVPASLRVNQQIAIPRGELEFSFVRSSGPGGQNVNKVASKAVLRWNVAASAAVSDEVRRRFAASFSSRINDRGELVINSQRYRDQLRNIDDCLAKLKAMLLTAAKRPTVRKKTKPTKAARQARLNDKRAASEKKQRRKLPSVD
jgi:ribosome-associated protein